MPREDDRVPFNPDQNWLNASEGSVTESFHLKRNRDDPLRRPWTSFQGHWQPISPTSTISRLSSACNPSSVNSSSPSTPSGLSPKRCNSPDITRFVLGGEISALEKENVMYRQQLHGMAKDHLEVHRRLMQHQKQNAELKECVYTLTRFIACNNKK